MAIMLDADVIIRGEKDHFDLARWLVSRANDQFEIAAITVAELWHGVERATGLNRIRRRRYIQSIVQALPVIAYTEQTAYHHAKIWAGLQSEGKMIGFYDIIVAATAIERGSTLATFNKRHFGQITGLKIVELV
ncbi:MAG TPA: PIN domain-containing protein [Phycisphaerae bacterium]|nr:PIN domain-containing protein [Phycisphaerae bacterium]